MWDEEECSLEDRAGAQAILSSWAIPAGILLGLMAWSGIQALLTG
jgi:hypothetical protein